MIDITNERLIEMYTLILKREGKPHKLGDVVKYLENLDYDYDLFMTIENGEPYIDSIKINDLGLNYEIPTRPF